MASPSNNVTWADASREPEGLIGSNPAMPKDCSRRERSSSAVKKELMELEGNVGEESET